MPLGLCPVAMIRKLTLLALACVACLASAQEQEVQTDALNGFTLTQAQRKQRAHDLFLRARARYLLSDFDGAQDALESLLEIEPNYPQAGPLLVYVEKQKASKKKKKHPHIECERTRALMLAEVDQAWERPQLFMPHDPEDDLIEYDTILEKLRNIRIRNLSLREVPLGEAIGELADLSYELDTDSPEAHRGLNMVLIDPEHKNPLITLSLRNVWLEQALDMITKAGEFQYDIENELIAIRPGSLSHSTLETDFIPITRAAVIRLTGDRSLEHLRTRDNAGNSKQGLSQRDEEDLIKAFLGRAGIPFAANEGAPSGASLAFDGTQLIVTQSPRNLRKIRNILARYSRVKQVEIETKFIEVQEGVLDELSFKWSAGSRRDINSSYFQTAQLGKVNSLNSTSSGTDSGFRTLSQGFPSLATQSGDTGKILSVSGTTNITHAAPSVPNTLNLGTNVVPFAGFSGVLNHFQVSLAMTAIQEKTGSDLLSAPRVTVLSGKTAHIDVVQQLIYPSQYGNTEAKAAAGSKAALTISAGTPQNFISRDVGVSLAVTPTVEDDDRQISMKLDPKITEFQGFIEYGGSSLGIAGDVAATTPAGFYQPIFTVREVTTEVSIENGCTIVIGGLVREQALSVHDKIPVLGDIPLLGKLFRSDSESHQKRNLLIFVTANILSTGGAPVYQRLQSLPPGSSYKNANFSSPSGPVHR